MRQVLVISAQIQAVLDFVGYASLEGAPPLRGREGERGGNKTTRKRHKMRVNSENGLAVVADVLRNLWRGERDVNCTVGRIVKALFFEREGIHISRQPGV